MENNTMTFFNTIVDEFSGKEFTKEDLMNKLRHNDSIFVDDVNQSPDDNVWMSKDGFSIINITNYPELSDDKLRMLSELMEYYDSIPGDCHDDQSSQFMRDLKSNRMGIECWYNSIFPQKIRAAEIETRAMKFVQHIRDMRCTSGEPNGAGAEAWRDIYDNEDYCRRIIEQDKDRWIQGFVQTQVQERQYITDRRKSLDTIAIRMEMMRKRANIPTVVREMAERMLILDKYDLNEMAQAQARDDTELALIQSIRRGSERGHRLIAHLASAKAIDTQLETCTRGGSSA